MTLNRRDLLAGAGGIAATAAFGKLGTQLAPAPALAAKQEEIPPGQRQTGAGFPRKADFNILEGATYLNNASTHPMPVASMQAYLAFVERRGQVGAPAAPAGGGSGGRGRSEVSPTAAFAALINAKLSEVGYVQNTSNGENLVIESLGLDRKFEGNVVTDWLHFEGALVHLMELRKQGLDVRVARPRDGRIDMKDLERLVDKNTKLIEVSFVAMYNGFQHDLKAVSDLAHAHGAYVYADIIQGVGAVPLDVRDTGVDFAACATYKWLMGDFGLGFFFCREELIGKIRHPHVSYPSASIEMHHSPFDPRHDAHMTYTLRSETSAMSQTGTTASGVAAALGVSLPYLQELGVENIQNYRRPLLKKLQDELPRLGFTPQTPPESTSPIVTFALKDTSQAAQKLRDARVTVSVYPYAIRIAPSIYNDMADVDR
ncbi:MAG: aminotransferase class V-fold PLP-dependent enzyme, partial [Acidobacteriota bacterium]